MVDIITDGNDQPIRTDWLGHECPADCDVFKPHAHVYGRVYMATPGMHFRIGEECYKVTAPVEEPGRVLCREHDFTIPDPKVTTDEETNNDDHD